MITDDRRQTADHRRIRANILCLLSLVFGLWSSVCFAETQSDLMLKKTGLEKRFGAMAALDTPWKTSEGKDIILNELFNKKPVILVPVYFKCPMLCQLILKGLANGLNKIDFLADNNFDLIVFSINPDESLENAAGSKKEFLKLYTESRHAQGVNFLTGSQTAIQTLTKSVGFKYEKDPVSGEFVHSSILVFLSPEGKIMRYMSGIEFDARSMKLGLIEAANGKVGSFWDQILLICYHYNPAKGKYSMAVDRILQVTGIMTALSLFGFIFFSLRSDKAKLS